MKANTNSVKYNFEGIKLTDQKRLIEKALDRLIVGEVKKIDCENIVSKYIEEWFDMYDNMDFHGWQGDWWDKMNYKGKVVSVFGEMYYGEVHFSMEE